MAKIGIDFGTSFSTVSCINPRTHLAEPIRINGKEKIPTLLYFDKSSDKPLCGEEAYAMYELCRKTSDQNRVDELLGGVICNIKRDMSMDGGQYLPSGIYMTWVDLVAAFLKYLKTTVEMTHFEGEKVTDVCIAYPVTHPEYKKEIMLEAARKAGFVKVKLLMEPVAAAMGYNCSKDYRNHSILVYDFGGGTFDIAFVKFDSHGDHLTLKPLGDSQCGGEDVDMALYKEWENVVRQSTGKSISGLDGIIDTAFLKTDCRLDKERLSGRFRQFDKAACNSFIAGDFRELNITKDEWNIKISPIINKTIMLTQQMLEDVKAHDMRVDKTILIGGSSRIPLVYDRLTEILPTPPTTVPDIDVAVANGAAMHINEGEVQVKRCFCRKCGHEINTRMKFCPFDGVDNIRFDYKLIDQK